MAPRVDPPDAEFLIRFVREHPLYSFGEAYLLLICLLCFLTFIPWAMVLALVVAPISLALFYFYEYEVWSHEE